MIFIEDVIEAVCAKNPLRGPRFPPVDTCVTSPPPPNHAFVFRYTLPIALCTHSTGIAPLTFTNRGETRFTFVVAFRNVSTFRGIPCLDFVVLAMNMDDALDLRFRFGALQTQEDVWAIETTVHCALDRAWCDAYIRPDEARYTAFHVIAPAKRHGHGATQASQRPAPKANCF